MPCPPRSSTSRAPRASITRSWRNWARRRQFPGATDIIRIDGLRVEYPDGFGLARGSNTTPVIVLRFEADDAAALERIKGEFRRVLDAAKPGIALPF